VQPHTFVVSLHNSPSQSGISFYTNPLSVWHNWPWF